jgi:GNAT superfamily N-acetyltransferase
MPKSKSPARKNPVRKPPAQKLKFHPLTPQRWSDFVELFGKRGAYGGCWCMWWRRSRREFEAGQGTGNKRAMKYLVDKGEVPGILAYAGKKPVGWCAIAPRETFGTLERSRVLKRLDDRPVWSLVCFFIHKDHRGQGVGQALIEAAVQYAKKKGGKVVEAYPTRPRAKKLPPVSSFMGVPAMYERAGFEECARPSPSRVIMRYYIEK